MIFNNGYVDRIKSRVSTIHAVELIDLSQSVHRRVKSKPKLTKMTASHQSGANKNGVSVPTRSNRFFSFLSSKPSQKNNAKSKLNSPKPTYEKVVESRPKPHSLRQQPESFSPISKDKIDQLSNAYPKVYNHLVKLVLDCAAEDNLFALYDAGEQLASIAVRGGGGIANASLMNKTVHHSLNMKQSQFGNLPVIADLMSTSTQRQKKKRREVSELERLASELGNFLTVTTKGKDTIVVENCPHCVANTRKINHDCYLILGFLNRFAEETIKSKTLSFEQVSRMAAGANACRIKIEIASSS